MNTSFFIARRFTFDREGKKAISRSIVQISVFAISLSLAVMLITLSVVTGFKKEIRNRVIGFGSHIQIINLDSNNSFESEPISANQDFLPALKNLPGVKHIQVFANKAGIIRSQTEIQGVFVKGIGKDFDWDFFNENMVEGHSFTVNDSVKTNDVVISKKLAALLKLKLNDEFAIFFIDERPRIRKFHICGLFETSLEEFDRQFILADIGHIQKLYDWDKDQISGFEILIDDYDRINSLTESVKEIAGYKLYEDGSQLRVTNVIEKYPQVFSWLGLLDMNVKVILILMSIVAVINMISGLIILILDRTKSIGLLKALGADNSKIRKIFIFQSFFLIVKGMIIGNVIAFLLCYLQYKFQIIKLDQASYFISYAPVNFSLGIFVITNVLCFLMILASMYLPTILISRIDPSKTLHYE